MDDLVKRLLARKKAAGFKSRPSEDGGHTVAEMQYAPDPDCQKAAARIEELEAAWLEAEGKHSTEQHRADRAQAMLKEAEVALRKIVNCGQTSEPDHWKFRLMARETALVALARIAQERKE